MGSSSTGQWSVTDHRTFIILAGSLAKRCVIFVILHQIFYVMYLVFSLEPSTEPEILLQDFPVLNINRVLV